MDKIVDEQEEEDETDEELPDINILPDDEMGDMEWNIIDEGLLQIIGSQVDWSN